VVLTNDEVPKEMGIRKKEKNIYNTVPMNAIQNMVDDDDIIDYFLTNNEKFITCPFFLKGNCRYNEKCKYMHPLPGKAKKVIAEVDDECCICMD